MLVLAQNPGADEVEGRRLVGYEGKEKVYEATTPQPLIGPTGYELDRTYLPLAGLTRGQVSVANVLKCRWAPNGKSTNDLPKGVVLSEAVAHCTQRHLRIPAETKLIVAMGALAAETLGCPGPVHEWRGHLLPRVAGGPGTKLGLQYTDGRSRYPDPDVLVVLHVADLLRDPSMSRPSGRDWAMVPRALSGEWPRPVPDAEPNMAAWFAGAHDAKRISLDTEWNPETGTLLLVGLSYGERILQVQWQRCGQWVRDEFTRRYRELAATKPFVIFNALADVPVMREATRLDWTDYLRIDDPLQAHAVLWAEMEHTLEFCASLYGRYAKVKHLSKVNPLLYNRGDLLEAEATMDALDKEFAADPEARGPYEDQLALMPTIEESMRKGIAVNAARVEQALGEYRVKVDAAVAMAMAFCGWPMNIGSADQLAMYCYDIEGMTPQKKRRRKQDKAATPKRKETVDDDAVAELRRQYLGYDPDTEDKNLTPQRALERIEDGAHPLLEARVLHTNAAKCISNYLRPLILGEGRWENC